MNQLLPPITLSRAEILDWPVHFLETAVKGLKRKWVCNPSVISSKRLDRWQADLLGQETKIVVFTCLGVTLAKWCIREDLRGDGNTVYRHSHGRTSSLPPIWPSPRTSSASPPVHELCGSSSADRSSSSLSCLSQVRDQLLLQLAVKLMWSCLESQPHRQLRQGISAALVMCVWRADMWVLFSQTLALSFKSRKFLQASCDSELNVAMSVESWRGLYWPPMVMSHCLLCLPRI